MTRQSMDHRRRFTAALVAAALFSPTALVMAADPSAVPPAQTQNGVTYVTGGIGQPESTAMESAAGQYDLMMTFARTDGAFVASVQVSIADQQGAPVLDVLSGPILLVDLPDGTYTISASFEGDSKARTITVGAQHQRLAYTWPATGG